MVRVLRVLHTQHDSGLTAAARGHDPPRVFLTGTLLNVAAVLLGTTLGLLAGARVPPRMQESLTTGLGFFTLLIATAMALPIFTSPDVRPGDELAVLGGLLGGVVIGERLLRDGEPPSALRHNCSGKHAGMALHAKAAGWPIETYWQAEHPVQRAALETVAALSDVPVEEIVCATDGCGVVTFGMPLRGLALAFARLADPSGVPDAPLRAALERIRDAMMAHPELIAGERRMLDTALMRTAPGRLVAKGGAEGVQAVGLLPGGHERGRGAIGLALKVEDGDGARRARATASVASLRQLGALDEEAIGERGRLADFASPPIRDPRGERSGEVRAVFTLD